MPGGRVLYEEEGGHHQQQPQVHEEFDHIQHDPDDAVHASEVVEPVIVFSPAHAMHSSAPGCVASKRPAVPRCFPESKPVLRKLHGPSANLPGRRSFCTSSERWTG